MRTTRLPAACYQFRLWEDSGFDRVVIEKIKRRAEQREAERIKRRLVTPVPRIILRASKKIRIAWEREQAERIAREDARWAHQEAILRDPGHTDEEKAAARLALAGRMYRELRKAYPDDSEGRREP